MFSKDSKAVADFINSPNPEQAEAQKETFEHDIDKAIAEGKLPPSGYDFHINAPQRRKLIEAIYNALSRKGLGSAAKVRLLACSILIQKGLHRMASLVMQDYQGLNYDKPNDNESSQQIQLIPTPEKLFKGKKGTCLDLSILFCAICWHYDLLPILILTKPCGDGGAGHAFVAVSLTHRGREWDKIDRQGQAIFNCKGLTNQSNDLFELEEEDYLAVECTGFARSTTLSDEDFQRNSGGLLTFQQATELGRQKLDNAANNDTLKVAIDIAHSGYKKYWWHEICHKHIEGKGKSWIDTFFKVEESSQKFYVGMELFKRNPIATPRTSSNNESSNQPDFPREQEGDCRYQDDQFFERVLQEKLTANSKGKPIVIIGEPGSGKTTLLREIANWVDQKHGYPIWISLADIRESAENWLEEYLYKKWLKNVKHLLNGRNLLMR
jgi:ABC-type multidrug transport system fused ATPase/permease subunit